MISRPIAVFDLDGTLADSALDLIATLNVILAQEGIPEIAEAQGRAATAHGVRQILRCGYAAGGLEVGEADLDRLHPLFLAHYEANLCVATRLFPGAAEALGRLEARGFLLAVCTNKPHRLAERLLADLDIAHRFAAICGRETFPYAKPDPRHLTMTIARAGGDPSRAVMIGDSEADVLAAQRAGIPCIGVSFGYSPLPMAEYGASRVIDSFDELPDAVGLLVPDEPEAGIGRLRATKGMVGATGIEPVTLRV